MAEKDYSHRSVVDKLGLKPGMRVRMTGNLGNDLKDAAKTGSAAACSAAEIST